MQELQIILQNYVSGGGNYGQEEGQIKIGKWVEVDEQFQEDKQVTYEGEFNFKGMKVGRWDTIYKGNVMQIFSEYSGGGSYFEGEGQIKIGKWVDLWMNFGKYKEVTYNGEYDQKGVKVGRWDICQNRDDGMGYNKIGGGSFYEGEKLIKIGRWIELWEGFWSCAQVFYRGEYNIKGMKVGRWDIIYEGDVIGGGCYSEGDIQIKIGKWVELDEEFDKHFQVSYNGEYNLEGMKIGTWEKIDLSFQGWEAEEIQYNT